MEDTKIFILLLKKLRVLTTLFYKEYENKMLPHCNKLSICNCSTCSNFMMHCKQLFKTPSGSCFGRNHSSTLSSKNSRSSVTSNYRRYNAVSSSILFRHTVAECFFLSYSLFVGLQRCSLHYYIYALHIEV